MRSFVLINKMFKRKGIPSKIGGRPGYWALKKRNAEIERIRKRVAFDKWRGRVSMARRRRRLASNPRQLAGIIALVVQALMGMRKRGGRK